MTLCRKPRQSGFSLLELVVILVLVGVAVTLILPSFTTGFKGLELEITGRDLIVEMKRARSEAIGKQKVFRILLQTDRYVLADDFQVPIRTSELPEGVVLESDQEKLPLKVSFYANGRSSGAAFRLKNETGKQLRISVDPITGFAKVIRDDS